MPLPLKTCVGPRNNVLDEEVTLVLPGEYDGMICAVSAMWAVATITVTTCLFLELLNSKSQPTYA